METVSALFARLQKDEWRLAKGFSAELAATQDQIFAEADKPTQAAILRGWLQAHQPCLFGRLAARNDQLGFSVLSESDLRLPDRQIGEAIQRDRTRWKAQTFTGHKSGFILFVVSPRISASLPSPELAKFAKRIAFLYLQTPIELDTIYLENIFLEKPGPSRQTWHWSGGVNYFCANADGRWWQDHRIPAGMAFSVNSVGHMAKAGKIARYMKGLDEALGSSSESWASEKVDDLSAALRLAMQTISLASDACSGKATWLKPVTSVENESPKCPITLPASLARMDHCTYAGYYNTDVTLPSEYFLPNVDRPKHVPVHELDFTYLFDNDVENSDYMTMGEGVRIRKSETSRTSQSRGHDKKFKVVPRVSDMASFPDLLAALETQKTQPSPK